MIKLNASERIYAELSTTEWMCAKMISDKIDITASPISYWLGAMAEKGIVILEKFRVARANGDPKGRPVRFYKLKPEYDNVPLSAFNLTHYDKRLSMRNANKGKDEAVKNTATLVGTPYPWLRMDADLIGYDKYLRSQSRIQAEYRTR